jgi:hypothetical protein
MYILFNNGYLDNLFDWWSSNKPEVQGIFFKEDFLFFFS